MGSTGTDDVDSVEAVVVGSGPNGLAAAIALAEHGRSVLVLEAAERLGGAVATEELTLPGFRHDVFSSVYPAAAASPVFGRLPLERHGLRWVQPEVAMAHPFDDGTAALLHRDVDATAASLNALGPGDGDRWRDFVRPYVRHGRAVRRTLLSGFPPLRGPLSLLAGLGPTGALELARIVLLPADALARELFHDRRAPAWLYGAAIHGDVPPDGAGSAIVAVYLGLLGHLVGWPSPEGGAGRLSDALVGRLHELGGRTRTGARVDRVVVERGRVRGVEAQDGTSVAARLVICDLTPAGLVRVARDALPSGHVRRLRRFRHGPETFKVDWALDGPIPWSSPDVRRAGTVHVGGSADELLRAAAELRAGRLSERPFLLLGQQSVADPTRAPRGGHTAWAYTHTPQDVDWRTERDRHVERVERQVERFAPGFRERILARHVLGPAELEGRDANLVGGDVGSGSNALDQLVFRPLPSLNPYRTPVRGLYLGSASTFPGGAVHGVAGDAAARTALRDLRLRRV